MSELSYKAEANKWIEALPIGNGKTGAMLFGSFTKERIAVNDGTLWSGYPKQNDNPESLDNLEKARELLRQGKYKKADVLIKDKMKGGYSESYLPLGDIFISYDGANGNDYERKLSLDNAIFSARNDNVTVEAFANFPSDVIAYKINAKTPISCVITLSSQMPSSTVFDGTFCLIGRAPDEVVPNYVVSAKNPIKYDEDKGMAFCLALAVETSGKKECFNDKIKVENATEIILYFASATGFIDSYSMPITDKEIVKNKAKAKLIDLCYDKLKKEHIADYQAIYQRQSVKISNTSGKSSLQLLNDAKNGDVSSELIETFYNFGKYLLIAGSRQGGQALTLQGLWNEDIRPAWSSNYTVNINTEMNYWPSIRCNLVESVEPFINLVYELIKTGEHTAKVNYGAKGFCCNHNVDIWRKTSPAVGACNFMFEPLCGAWLANEAYEHYKNGKLSQYEDKIKAVVTKTAEFLVSYLVKEEGYYIITPSTSPEAVFRHNLINCNVSVATAFDMAVTRQALANYLEIDDKSAFSKEVAEKLNALYPIKVGRSGISEFYDDKKIIDKGHRHFSPLYAFYPSSLIGYYQNPTMREAVRKLFNERISHSKNHIGWSAGWGICLASRLRDGKTASDIIKSLFKNSVFDNLFDAHFPSIFQIDGNFGFVAGINESLLTVEDGVIEFLPAKIKYFDSGVVKGMVVNGVTIDFEFSNYVVTKITTTDSIRVVNKNIAQNCVFEGNIKLEERE